MTAVVAGNGLGLERSSANLLGSRGQLGSASLGRGNQLVTVNGANGNLVIQTQDEFLVGRGADAAFSSSYNSLGAYNGSYTNLDGSADADGWLLNTQRKIVLGGTGNTAGSTATLTDWDGTQIVFTYNTSTLRYEASEHPYADDILTWAGNVFTYTEGKSRTVQTFASDIGGRLIDMKDADGNAVTFTYSTATTAGQLTRVTTANSSGSQFNYVDYVYDTVNRRLTLSASYYDAASATNKTISRIVYAYDTANRLSSVTTDLTPSNGADSSVYTVAYTYKDATSKLVTGIAQSDGTSFTIAYDASNRVQTLTQAMAAGVSQTTSFAYDTANRITMVTDALSNVYNMTYDTAGRLVRLKEPAAIAGGNPTIKSFVYDAAGAVTEALIFDNPANAGDPSLANAVERSRYDASGNLLERVYGDNSAVFYTYGALNELLTETHYTGFDANGLADAAAPTGAMVTHYVYDEGGNNGVNDDGTTYTGTNAADVAEKHLRFSISAEGRVSEYRYDDYGQRTATIVYTAASYSGSTWTEAALAGWVAGVDKTQTQRTDTSYDFRGNLTQLTRWEKTDAAGAGLATADWSRVDYTYDQAGRLLSRRTSGANALGGEPTPVTETFVYDGLGRQISSTDLLGQTTTVTISDGTRTTAVSTPNDPTDTLVENVGGTLASDAVSAAGVATATVSRTYDALGRLRTTTDAAGVTSFYVYDRQNRLAAAIDGDGSMTEYKYDGADRIVATARYAAAVSAANLSALANPAVNTEAATIRPSASAADRWSWTVYNKAGRVIETIDAAGIATVISYDGAGRATASTVYANAIAAATLNGADGVSGFRSAPPAALVLPTASATLDRTARTFFDNDGLLMGTLDADGFLTELVYDKAGRKTETIGYSGATSAGLRASGTFAQLKASVTLSAANDIHNYWLYDGQGRLVAAIDGEGDVTRYHYTVRGDLDQEVRGQKVTASTAYTLATLPAGSGTLETTRYVRNAAGLTTSRVRTLSSGTETVTYTYDSRGRLLTQTTSETVSADTRTQTDRYDAKGRLAGQLSGVGSAALAALGGSPSQAQIDAVYATYGTLFSYDAADRLIARTTPDGSGSAGLKTVYYYDGDGQLRFEINALGEVVEHRFNVLEDQTDTYRYATRLSAGTLATLTGGLVTATVTNAVAAIANAAADSRTQLAYDNRGALIQSIDSLGQSTAYSYSSFGELLSSAAAVSASPALTDTHLQAFSARGLKLYDYEVQDAANLSTYLRDSYSYDAFGRRTQTVLNGTDQRYEQTSYDRAGEVLTQRDALGATTTLAYDARGNRVSSTDRNGKTTSYAFDQFNRTVTATTAEGIVTTVKANAYGQTISVTDGAGRIKTYTYDKDGNLKTVTDAAGTTTYSYDNADRLIDVVDAKGIDTHFSYDAAGRVLTQVADYGSGKLNLTTTTVYDAKGEVISVTDPIGTVTTYQYDRAGQRTRVVQDAGSGRLNITTDFAYRADGKVISQTDAVGTAQQRTTSFEYDGYGRLTRKIEDSGAGRLNVATQYFYDVNGNIAATTDALGRTTRFVFDADNRLALTIDAEGQVTQNLYDSEGRVTATRRYTGTLSAAQVALLADPSLPAQWNEFSSAANGDLTITRKAKDWSSGTVTPTAVATITATGADRVTRSFYDGDGRAVYAVDGEGYVTQNVYDRAGNVIQTIRYTAQTSLTNASTTANVAALFPTALAGGAPATGIPADAAVTAYAFDGANRLTDVTDAAGTVTHFVLDAAGQVTETHVAYGTPDVSIIRRVFDNIGRVASETAAYGQSEAATVSYGYNGLGQVISTTDARGYTTTRAYDALGRMTSETVPLDASATATTSYEYDARGNRVKVIDPRGNTGYVYYDNLDRAWLQTDPEGYVVKTEYAIGSTIAKVIRYANAATNLASVSATTLPVYTADPAKDAVSLFTYDKTDRVKTATDGEGFVESYSYDALGNRTSVTNKLGGVTSYTYDRRGRMTAEMRSQSAYDAAGTLVLSQVQTTYAYDSRGNLIQKFEGANIPASGTNIGYGRLITSYAYDKLDRLVTQTDPAFLGLTPVTSWQYDKRGNVILQTAADGGKTYSFYDHNNRKTAEISPVNALTNWTYDANGNVTSQRLWAGTAAFPASPGGTAPVGGGAYRETQLAYDRNNRLIQTSILNVRTGAYNGSAFVTAAAQTLVSTNQYGASGNLVKETDANGNSVYHYYDRRGQEIAKVDQENALTTWTRDADGNVVQETRFATRVSGTPTVGAAPTVAADATNDRTTLFTYDRMGRRLAETRTGLTAYKVDAGGTLVADASAATVTYTYNGLGEVLSKQEATLDRTDYQYDLQGRLERQLDAVSEDFNASGTATARHATYFYYDANDNIVRTVERAETGSAATGLPGTTGSYGTGYSSANDRVATFGYNGNKLQWTVDATGAQRNYWYDVMGHRTYDYYQRADSSGTVDTTNAIYEGSLSSYDLGGRVISQWQATYNSAGTWVTQGPITQYSYDTAGEVTGRYLGGFLQESFEYDNAGRVTKSTGGDGVQKFVVYDANGNATLVLQSNGRDMSADTVDSALAYVGAIDTMTATDVVATITTFDKRNMALATREPNRTIANAANTATTTTQTLVRSRTYTAFGDTASETDARGNTTNYSYDVMGRMTVKQAPTVNVTGENGVVTAMRPTEHYAYDVSGRMIAMQDANGNWTRHTLLAGTGYGGTDVKVRKEYRPDASVWETRYDVFGNAAESYDGLQRKTVNLYDKANRLIQITRPSGLIESFGYDVLGQRVKHWNNVFQTPIYGDPVWVESGYYEYPQYGPPYREYEVYDDPTWVDTSHWETPIIGYTPTLELTDYDIQGRIVKTKDFAGEVTTSTNSWSTAAAASNSGLGLTGGWVKNTSYANGHTTSETTDAFGHVLARTDLGGHTYTMAYNRAGQQVSQISSAGQSLLYTYYNTGRLAGMNDNASLYMGWSTSNIDSSYTYDADGNRTYERMAGTYTSYDWYGGYYVYSIVHQEAKATWDAMNRFVSYSDTGANTGNGAVSIANEYDANGNVRRTVASHLTINSNQSFGAQVTEDYWYRYDSLNQMTLVKGSLVGGAIVRGLGPDAREITYNAAGERASQSRTTVIYNPYYGYGFTMGYAEEREVYSYNADGLITDVQIGTGAMTMTGTTTAPTSYTLRAHNSYDLLGRVTDYKEYAADGTTVNFNRYGIGYDNHNASLYETTSLRRVESDGYLYVSTSSTSNTYSPGGVLTSSTSYNYRYKNGTTYQDVPDTRSTYSYVWWDSAQQSGISYDSDINSSSNPIFNTSYSYDTNGRLSYVSVQDGRPRTISYVTDASGQILMRTEADNLSGGDPKQIWWYFDGKQVGTTGNNGNADPDYATALNERVQTPPSSTTGAFRMGASAGTGYSDFDQAYNSVSPGDGTGAGTAYTVRSGDTLASIAQSIYGDASLWYEIADANGLNGASSLAAGQQLKIPSSVSNAHNTSSTFRPYDAASHIGDVAPTTPKPPKKSPCGVFGQILLAVIAIAVAVVVTAGAAAVMTNATLGSALGAMFGGAALTGATVGTFVVAGAIGGAVGSIVSQGIGVATGLQDHFSWKSVALAGIGGAVGGYFQGLGNAAKLATEAAAKGAAGVASGAANLANGATQTAKQLTGFAKFISGSGFTNTVSRAVVSNLAQQGIGLVTGLQSKFSWSGLAGAAVGSMVGFGVGKVTGAVSILGPQGSASIGNIAANVATSAASMIANAAARSMIDGTDFGDNVIAALPDTIAQTLADLALKAITGGVAEMAPPAPSPTTGAPANLSDTQARSAALEAGHTALAATTVTMNARIAADDAILIDPARSAADKTAALADKNNANATLAAAQASFTALANTTYTDAMQGVQNAQAKLASDRSALTVDQPGNPSLTTLATTARNTLTALPATAPTVDREKAIADSLDAGTNMIKNAADQVVDVRRMIGNSQLALNAANYLGDPAKIAAATGSLSTANGMLAPQEVASRRIVQSVFANSYMPALEHVTINGVSINALHKYMTAISNVIIAESPERAAALRGIGNIKVDAVDYAAQDPNFVNDPGYGPMTFKLPRGYEAFPESSNGMNQGQTASDIKLIDLQPDATHDQRSYDVVNHEINHMFDKWLGGYLGPALRAHYGLGNPVGGVLSASPEFSGAYGSDLGGLLAPSPSGTGTVLDGLIANAAPGGSAPDSTLYNFLTRWKPDGYFNQRTTVPPSTVKIITPATIRASQSEAFAEGWVLYNTPAYQPLFSSTGPFSNMGTYFGHLNAAMVTKMTPPAPHPHH